MLRFPSLAFSSVALSANPYSTVSPGVKLGVGLIEGMPSDAMGLGAVAEADTLYGTLDVDAYGDTLQMARPYTRGIGAQMVAGQGTVYRDAGKHHRESMGGNKFALVRKSPISILIGSTHPKPALSKLRTMWGNWAILINLRPKARLHRLFKASWFQKQWVAPAINAVIVCYTETICKHRFATPLYATYFGNHVSSVATSIGVVK